MVQTYQYLVVFVVALQGLQLAETLDTDQWHRVTPQSHQHGDIAGDRLLFAYSFHQNIQEGIWFHIRHARETVSWIRDGILTHRFWSVQLVQFQSIHHLPCPQAERLLAVLRSHYWGNLTKSKTNLSFYLLLINIQRVLSITWQYSHSQLYNTNYNT